MKLAHARINERGTVIGGLSGDQTGKEVCLTDFQIPQRPWNMVLRHPNGKIRAAIAKSAASICVNDMIGYDQGDRLSLDKQAKVVGYDFSKIKNPCSCDCSSMVAACVNAAGLQVNPAMYTGNEAAALKNLGFEVLIDRKYLTSPDYLLDGDILLAEGCHTAIVLGNGSYPISITGKVLKPCKVGTVLKAEDFEITVKWVDCEITKNPPYWSAEPLQIKADTTHITLRYRDVTGIIRLHVVKKGDTLWKLAADYLGSGAKYPEIKKMNGLKNDNLEVGQVLFI